MKQQRNMIQTKYIPVMLAFLCLVLISMQSVDAYQRLCLTYGQSVPEDNPRYTCFSNICQICVTDSHFPTHPGHCNGIQGCDPLGETTVDSDPPELTVDSPENGFVYNTRKVLFDITSSEPASLTYLDLINGRGRWKKMASNVQEYYKALSFKEGFNNITIRARDRNGNEITVDRHFYVDSKKPKIKKTEPRKGYADGNFRVEFSEDNPEKLELTYGNVGTGFETVPVDLGTCTLEKRKNVCETNVDLTAYNNQDIQYWFYLEDKAGSSHESRRLPLSVDTTPPVILNEDIYRIDGRKVYFTLEIEETNFDTVVYIDQTERRPRAKKLCSRLRDDVCEKRKTFRRGPHNVDVQVIDEAGNAVSRRIDFTIE